MGAAVGDYDNDGDLDLFVTAFGPDALFRNNGDGTFTDVTREAGRERPALEHERRVPRLRPRRRPRSLRRALSGLHARRQQGLPRLRRRARLLQPARLPAGARSAVPQRRAAAASPTSRETAGISKADGAGLGVSIGDYNGDGWLDLYVANDATPNQLWINRRDGTFADEGLLSGAALQRRGQSRRQHGDRVGRLRRSTATRISSSPTSSARRSRCTSTTGKGNFEDGAYAGGPGGADRGLHRLRHRLVRLRQRRLARSVHRQRRRQRRSRRSAGSRGRSG